MNFLNTKTLEKQYKEHLSNFKTWEQTINPKALVYPENFGPWMSIDEVNLSKGELYTVITNKDRHGKKGSLAAIIAGTKCETVSAALSKVPVAIRASVREMTLDFANTMDWITRTNFMNARLTGDRFHIQQIVCEGVQELRIALRRQAIDQENEMLSQGGAPLRPKTYENGDTAKQLLARARYCLFKPSNKWTESQRERAGILFREYPDLEKAHYLSMNFRSIFENARTKEEAEERIKAWISRVNESGLKALISAAQTVNVNLGKILNYFPDGHTNAGAESFNAKLKGFRALVRGVRDTNFFLFRIATFFA